MPPIIVLDAAQTKTKAVTIYKSRSAEVTRTFTVELEVGRNEVKIESLSANIDIYSPRLTVKGGADAVLLSVEGTLEDTGAYRLQHSKEEKNKQERDRATIQKRALERKAELLTKYSQSSTRWSAQPGHASTTTALEEFLEITDSISDLDMKIAELDREATKLEEKVGNAWGTCISVGTTGAIIALIMAKSAGWTELELTYYIEGCASWDVGYDLHATTENSHPVGPVSLTYYARVQQNTGEEWNNIALTLSTAKPSEFAKAPQLHTLRVATQNRIGVMNQPVGTVRIHNVDLTQSTSPHQPQKRLNASAPLPVGLLRTTDTFQTNVPQGAVPLARQEPPFFSDTLSEWKIGEYDMDAATMCTEPIYAGYDTTEKGHTSTVMFNGTSTSYRIGGTWSIPTDDELHKVTIAVLTLCASVQYMVVPRIGKSASLQYEMTNNSKYHLFPAHAAVYLNNAYTSKAWIPDTIPGERFLCTIGTDPGIRIEYTRSHRDTSTFWSRGRRTTYLTTITLQNTHPFAIGKIIMQDSLPLPPKDGSTAGVKPQSIQVNLMEPKGLLDAQSQTYVDAVNKSRNGGSSKVKVGWVGEDWEDTKKYEWVASVGAGEEIIVDTEFEVRSRARNVQLMEEKA